MLKRTLDGEGRETHAADELARGKTRKAVQMNESVMLHLVSEVWSGMTGGKVSVSKFCVWG
jgi:hypothetical protein